MPLDMDVAARFLTRTLPACAINVHYCRHLLMEQRSLKIHWYVDSRNCDFLVGYHLIRTSVRLILSVKAAGELGNIFKVIPAMNASKKKTKV